MKTNGKRIILIALVAYLLLVVLSFRSYAQPDYDFSNGSLISGTDKQIGAKYRFTNVKPGVDAIVTISNISSGVRVSDLDGPSGYKEALQPTLQVDAGAKGHLEMLIEFVIAGGFVLSTQLEIPVTCIDVDGITGSVYEYDEISTAAGYYVNYDLLGNELLINTSPGWATCRNIGGVDYPRRDTAARQVMFTVVNANRSSIVVRVGADNTLGSGQATRLRSVYFKKFTYSNSFLSQPSLLSFRGNEKNGKVILNWELSADNHPVRIVVEKSNGAQFKSIGEIPVSGSKHYSFADADMLTGNTYYRLKMIAANGIVSYSNLLLFRLSSVGQPTLKVYPSIVNNNTTISLRADKKETIPVYIADMSGRIVFTKQLQVQEGSNNVVVDGLEKLTKGNYILYINKQDGIEKQKIIKQ